MMKEKQNLNLKIYSLVVSVLCISNEFISSFAFDVTFLNALANADACVYLCISILITNYIIYRHFYGIDVILFQIMCDE